MTRLSRLSRLPRPAAAGPSRRSVFLALACAWPLAFAQPAPVAPVVPVAPTMPVAAAAAAGPADPVAVLVRQLDLAKYKATVKGLTQFGDRRQGTERNRKALDWIEAQLKAYGCTNTERLQYSYTEPPSRTPGVPQPPRAGGPAGQGGSTLFGQRAATGVNTDPMAQPD